ncbi:VOC family protein [Emcibacter sp.]|uniref:VOC family protein n=1 Tax=Emcibacter sp. TaxID=1979954 RepID=UPI002AA8E792|nr:VOC family protein [Emcibacter sp.]
MAVKSLGYLALQVKDKKEFETLACEVLGMQKVTGPSVGAENDYYRIDQRAHRLIVMPGKEDRLYCAGWQVADSATLRNVQEKLSAKGVDWVALDDSACAVRGVDQGIGFLDPSGNRHEVCVGEFKADDPFVSPAGVSRFITGDMGMGHVVLPAPNFEETFEFCREVLGFSLSDELPVPMGADGPVLRVRFLHCANPRHHSLAIFEGEHPAGCVHWMLEVPDVDTVGLAMERAEKANMPLFSTLGRHTNDNMLSVYFMSPGAIGVEYGCDGLRMDWTGWEPKILESGDLWGHQYAMMKDL